MFFYAYVLTLVGAGASGLLFARYGLRWLVGLHLGSLRPSIEANLGGQYRFLRSIELGFGLFTLTYCREIFRLRQFNHLFFGTMGCGIVARLLGLGLDGVPSAAMFFFLTFEAFAFVLVAAATRSTLEPA